jgi:hypothetical protein
MDTSTTIVESICCGHRRTRCRSSRSDTKGGVGGDVVGAGGSQAVVFIASTDRWSLCSTHVCCSPSVVCVAATCARRCGRCCTAKDVGRQRQRRFRRTKTIHCLACPNDDDRAVSRRVYATSKRHQLGTNNRWCSSLTATRRINVDGITSSSEIVCCAAVTTRD